MMDRRISQTNLSGMLARSAASHGGRLCPRQVLGVRMGLAGAAWLQLDAPLVDKRLLVIAETDGCFLDGIEAATGCSVGRRTLRIEDYGKVAAAFIDIQAQSAVRLAPRPYIRTRAGECAPQQERRYTAQLFGYQRMPAVEMFRFDPIRLNTPVMDLVSRPGLRVNCERCGEEIMNDRQVRVRRHCLCRACAGSAYYSIRSEAPDFFGLTAGVATHPL